MLFSTVSEFPSARLAEADWLTSDFSPTHRVTYPHYQLEVKEEQEEPESKDLDFQEGKE